MELVKLGTALFAAGGSLAMGPGFHFPLRMVVAVGAHGGLWVHSPVRWSEALDAELGELGMVEAFVAPNGFHHSFVSMWAAKHPGAKVYAGAVAAAKHPDWSVAGDPTEVSFEGIDSVRIEGAPGLDEYVSYHSPTKSLIVADLVFNLHRENSRGWMTPWLLRLSGAFGRPAQSRLISMMTKDREAARQSLERVLALPFERIIPAHGDLIESGARELLEHSRMASS